MAEPEDQQHKSLKPQQNETQKMKKLFSSCIDLSFSVFLALFPNNLHKLSIRAFRAEEELRQMRSRRQEDPKANVRVAEIFASHRNDWRDDEKQLLQRIDAAAKEIARLRAVAADPKARVEELEREDVERDEVIGSVWRRIQEEGLGGCGSRKRYRAVPLGKKSGEWFHKVEEEMVGTANASHVDEEGEVIYQEHTQHFGNGFDSESIASSASVLWVTKNELISLFAPLVQNTTP